MLAEHTSISKVDLVFANNVFHWLFNEEQIQLAFCNCYDILDKNNGCLAASIAASGTGRLFHDAYAEECSRLLNDDELDKWRSHIKNPIGLQRLDSIVRIAKESKFKIALAHQEYEPIEFPNTDAYVEAARGYGEEVFMAPLPSLSDKAREAFWNRLKKNFREKYAAGLRTTGPNRDEKYVHDQFMIYILAIRRD
jgi:trans-aconitate methyltransferase